MLQKQSQRCKYNLLDNGIHEFIILEATRAAADDYFDALEALVEKLLAEGATPNDIVRVLADFCTAGNPPMNHMYQRSRRLLDRYPVHPKTRFANVHRSNFLLSIAQAFVSLLTAATRDKARIFVDCDREAAIAWLLEDQ
jgi:hypothetical protein